MAQRIEPPDLSRNIRPQERRVTLEGEAYFEVAHTRRIPSSST
ncbi:MAG: hypothetical protein ACLRMJ_03770 [Alistipes finegoldii]